MQAFSTTIIRVMALTPEDLHINQLSFKKQKQLTTLYAGLYTRCSWKNDQSDEK
jgi:hypothetical protein